jgi:CarboxypepD_reg-like domain
MLRWYEILFLAILLLPANLKAQQQNGSVLENRISVYLQNQPLNLILDQISWQAGVYFSYDASLLNSNKKYSIDVTSKSLYNVLNQLFSHNEYKFLELENQVVIIKNDQKILPAEILPDSIPAKYFFISGKITDSKKAEPVTYASVSVTNRPIGTISNNDGNFLLKIHPDLIRDTIVISCMGYEQIFLPAWKMLDEDEIRMTSVSIRLKEVKVVGTTPAKILAKIHENMPLNYSNEHLMMTGFYRETVQQDDEYINVSEAVIELLKTPYPHETRTDDVRIVKGRRSPDVKPFQWINFKLQGGPFTITRLDVVKTLESFISPEYQHLYSYNIINSIMYNNNPVYVLAFKPVSEYSDEGFTGELYVHRESYAIVHANFRYGKAALKNASLTLIKKKPRGVKAKLDDSDYRVNYQYYNGKWHLSTLKASVVFKIRSHSDKINAEFHSVSDLLITDIADTDLKNFERTELFTQRDIFVEMIDNYDAGFWENYNIISPEDDLENAFKKPVNQKISDF